MTTATKQVSSKLTVGLGVTKQPTIEGKPIFLGIVRDKAFLEGPQGVKWMSAKKARKLATSLNALADYAEGATNADTSVLDSDTPQGSSDTK